MQRTLKDYVQEVAETIDRPRAGDTLAINIREECLIESTVAQVTDDRVILEADQRMIAMLTKYGMLGEQRETTHRSVPAVARRKIREGDISQLTKDIADAPVKPIASMEEAVDPRLQAMVGKEYYVKSAGKKGHVERVSPEHRNALIVQFDDGSMDVVHFTDLEQDSPNVMRQFIDRMKSPLADRPVKIREGKMKDLALDLKELSDAEFEKKYGKTKAEMRAGLKESQHMLGEREIDIDGFRFDVDGVIDELRAWFDHIDTGEYLGDVTAGHIEHALSTGSPDARMLWTRMQDLPQRQFNHVIGQIVNHAYKAETDEYNRGEQDDEGGIAVDNLREGKFINPEDMYVYGNKFGYAVWGPGSGLMLTDPQGNAREYWDNIRYSEIRQLIQQREMEAVSIESLPGRIQKKFLYQLNDIIDPSLDLMGRRRLVGKGGAPNPSRDQLAVRQGLSTSRLKNQIRMEPDFLKGPQGALPEGAAEEGLKEAEDDDDLDGNAYEMGYRAAALYSKGKNSNPFEYDDPRHDEWLDGWREGSTYEDGFFEGSEDDCVQEDRTSMADGLGRDLMNWYRPQMMQALEQLGIDTVMDTIADVAEQYADAEEMGTSDRHHLCRRALEQLGVSRAAMRNEPGGLEIDEAEYQGRDVPLGKPMRGDVKKFKVYVKDPSTGNIKKVNFGDPNMRIKKSNPARRKSFRARHNCANPGPRTKARYWSCRKW